MIGQCGHHTALEIKKASPISGAISRRQIHRLGLHQGPDSNRWLLSKIKPVLTLVHALEEELHKYVRLEGVMMGSSSWIVAAQNPI